MRLVSIQQVQRDASRAFLRFPFVLIAAALGTISGLILVDYEGPPGPTVLFNILFAAVLGILLLTASTLFAEKRKWGKAISLLVQLACCILLAAYALTVPSDITGAPAIHPSPCQ